MAFIDLVQDYIGTVTTVGDLDKWLQAGAKFIIDLMPVGKAEKFTSSVTVVTAGTTISGYRIIRVHKGGYVAIKIDAGYKTQAEDTNSIYYATTKSPAYYIENGKAFVLPGGGILIGVAYPTPVNTDSSITNFPGEYENLVILYASIQGRIQQLTTQVMTDIDALTVDITTPVAPTAPTIPAYDYVDAAGTTLSVVSVGDLGTAPSYTKPTITMTSAPTDLAIASTPPTPPDAPSFAYSDAAASTVVQTAIGALGTAPTYTKPTITLTAAPTITDLTIASTAPVTPDAPAFTWSDAAAGTIAATSIADFGTAPAYSVDLPGVPIFSITGTAPTALSAPSFTYTDASVSPVVLNKAIDLATQFTALGTSLDTNEDIELANAKINEIQTRISEFKTESDIAVNEALKNAELTTDLNLKNEAQALVQQIQEYQAKVLRYSSELDKFKADTNAKYQEYSLSVQAYVTNSKNILEDGLNTFNEANTVYQGAILKNIEQAKITQQALIEAAQMTTDVNKFDKANTLLEQVQEYESKLKKYSEDIQAYVQKVNSEVLAWKSNADKNIEMWKIKRTTELENFQLDITNELNEFNKELAEYQSTVQKAIKQADLDQQRLLDNARRTDDTALQNEIQTIAALINLYRDSLGRFNGQVSLYGQNLNKEVQQWQSNLSKWQTLRQTELKQYDSDIQNELNEFNKDVAAYQANLQKVIKQADLDIERLKSDADRKDNIALQNEAHSLQAIIESWKDKISNYSSQVQSYSIQINAKLQKYSSQIQQEMGKYNAMQEGLKELKEQFNSLLKLHGLI
jgi:hypothetical protein